MMGWGVHDYPEPPEYTVPECPICGEETDTLYADKDGVIFGCDNCVKTIDAWDWKENNE